MLSLLVRRGGDDMSKICCFTGSRDIRKISYREVYLRLRKILIELIEKEGFSDFRAGGARGFDTIAALCIMELKATHPNIKLHLILPCKNQDRFFAPRERAVYRALIEMADSVTFLQEKYTSGVMHRRNRALVDGSDLCVALLQKSSGGTYQTVTYARSCGVKTVNIINI